MVTWFHKEINKCKKLSARFVNTSGFRGLKIRRSVQGVKLGWTDTKERKKMLKLRAVDCDKNAFYYESVCKNCGELFVYKSKNGLLKQLWDKAYFDGEFAVHQAQCINERILNVTQNKG